MPEDRTTSVFAALGEVGALARSVIELRIAMAKVSAKRRITRAASGVAVIVMGVGLVMLSVVFFGMAGCVALIEAGLSVPLAACLTAGGFLLLALVLILIGRAQLNRAAAPGPLFR